MFDQDKKTFHCDNCGKLISTGEKVWTKWQFPPKPREAQMKARKELEFENAPIQCLACAKEILGDRWS